MVRSKLRESDDCADPRFARLDGENGEKEIYDLWGDYSF
jgi:hypothetical protein